MAKPNQIVFTTIFYPAVLEDLLSNLRQFGHLDSTRVWVVVDRKTPPEAQDLCRRVSDQGLEVTYLDIATQDRWGAEFPDFYARIPYNNETRRNIGYLHALQDGCERLISIDDDNWPTADDFVGGHSLTGRGWDGPLLSEPSGYHNVCEYLTFDVKRPIFPRGFPFGLRHTANAPEAQPAAATTTVGVTAGLWLQDPDIDATTWLNGRVSGVGYEGPDAFALAPGTWSPINTQNTSVARALVPAYLCIPMGWEVPGGKIERYGDIWGGYFLQAVLGGLPYCVAFGRPLADHRRNPHNYVDDLRHEFWGMILTDWLVETLREHFQPTGDDVCGRVAQLGEFLRGDALGRLPTWCAPEVRAFLAHTGGSLVVWADACRRAL